jgi:hypothetical protein
MSPPPPPPYFVSKEAHAQSYYTVMVSTCVVSPKVANACIGTATLSDNLLKKMPNVSQMMYWFMRVKETLLTWG